MKSYKHEFIEFAINAGILKFGEFKLKSGRVSPYFFNIASCNDGYKLNKLASFYAQAIENEGINFDLLFGAAYKGIPLACSVALKLSEHNKNVFWSFNRKEAKDHGEGGIFVGEIPNGQVLLIDDVITAGTATREVMKIMPNNAKVQGLIIALDRMELGYNNKSSISELETEFGIKIFSIINMKDLIAYMSKSTRDAEILYKIEKYLEKYGG